MLKYLGIIKDGFANKVNNIVSALVAAAPIILQIFGLDAEFLDLYNKLVPGFTDFFNGAYSIFMVAASAGLISFMTGAIHKGAKWLKAGLTVR